MTAKLADGYHSVRWEGDHTSTVNPLMLGNIIEDMTITAGFEVNRYTVSFAAVENGRLEGETTQTVTHGNDATSVTPKPADDYRFVGWTGDHTGTENPLILENVTEDYAIQAVFAKPDEYSISVMTRGCCGSIDPSGIVSITEGESLAFTTTPDEHSKVAEILMDGEAVADIGRTYEFGAVNQDHTLSVTFTHVADVNNDLGIDLRDAVLLLTMLADQDPSAEMENLIWVLQVLAGMTDSSELAAEESDLP